MAAQNDCIPVMLAAAEEPMTEVQENMWVTYAKAARSAPANAAHTPIEDCIALNMRRTIPC
jgi:hypothetical protein